MTSGYQKLQSYLHQMSERFPECWKGIDEARASVLGGLPPYCFLPLLSCSHILTKIKGSPATLHDELCFSALASWRATQGVYRFDEHLYQELVEMEIGPLPAQVLKHLPEWCIYIELQEEWAEGVFAHIDVGRFEELRLLVVQRDDSQIDRLVPLVIPLTGSLADGMRVYKESVIDPHLAKTNRTWNFDQRSITKSIARLVSLVLYICSANADLSGKPKNPEPKKTKNGLRWFPPPRPTTWEVGYRIGPKLALVSSQHERDGKVTGLSVRPHVRRAHYHLYHTGPGRKEEKVKWLHPILVNVDGPDDLTTTIRPVPE